MGPRPGATATREEMEQDDIVFRDGSAGPERLGQLHPGRHCAPCRPWPAPRRAGAAVPSFRPERVGGVGAGLYGMLLFAILTVFIAGLMVGRTPEYVGKKIEAKEVKMTMLAILCLPFAILGFTALAVVLPAGLAAIQDAGPHGFSEVLYAFTSATANNGSAFAGLGGNTP